MSHRFRKGDLVQVEWTDPTGSVNGSDKDAKLAPCVTRGTVHSRKGKELVLWHSRYRDDVGDYTTLNTGCIDDWKILVKREEMC